VPVTHFEDQHVANTIPLSIRLIGILVSRDQVVAAPSGDRVTTGTTF
jgi:hypothetical protein